MLLEVKDGFYQVSSKFTNGLKSHVYVSFHDLMLVNRSFWMSLPKIHQIALELIPKNPFRTETSLGLTF